MSKIQYCTELTPTLYLNIFELLNRGIRFLNDNATINEIVTDINNGQKQLWVIWNDEQSDILAIFVTSIVTYGSERRLLYYLVVGDGFDDWSCHYEQIENWARANGCQKAEIYGRKGWDKKLKDFGFKTNYICMIKQL